MVFCSLAPLYTGMTANGKKAAQAINCHRYTQRRPRIALYRLRSSAMADHHGAPTLVGLRLGQGTLSLLQIL